MTLPETAAPIEVAFGDWVVRLDGNVIELLHRLTTAGTRFHISHVAVEAKPRGDALRLKVGHEVSGMIVGQNLDVPADRRDAVLALFAESRRRRDALTG